MMDRVHHMMDRVHHMMNRVHPLIEFRKNIGDTCHEPEQFHFWVEWIHMC